MQADQFHELKVIFKKENEIDKSKETQLFGLGLHDSANASFYFTSNTTELK